MRFYALGVGLGVATGDEYERVVCSKDGFYALGVGLGVATDAFVAEP